MGLSLVLFWILLGRDTCGLEREVRGLALTPILVPVPSGDRWGLGAKKDGQRKTGLEDESGNQSKRSNLRPHVRFGNLYSCLSLSPVRSQCLLVLFPSRTDLDRTKTRVETNQNAQTFVHTYDLDIFPLLSSPCLGPY